MAQKIYMGVNGVAKEAKSFYAGVGGVARKVIRAWVGVNGVARQFWQSDFWTAGGISPANCLAAYQFKGASSETVALTDLTGHGYTLTKSGSPTWATGTGFTMGTSGLLQNATLNKLTTIKTIILRYSNLPSTDNKLYIASQIKGRTSLGTDNPLLYYRLSMSRFVNGAGVVTNINYPVVITSWNTDTSKLYIKKGDTKLASSGTLGYSNNVIYANGTAQTTTSETLACESTSTEQTNLSTSTSHTLHNGGGVRLLAAAFYNVNLTAAQHKAVANAMLAL